MDDPLIKIYGERLQNELEKSNMMLKQSDGVFKPLPIGLKPVPIPEQDLKKMKPMQMELIDKIIFKIVYDEKLLPEMLKGVAENDEFVRRLLEIHQKFRDRGMFEKKPYLSVIRSDFFYEKPEPHWKLIEINTVSVAGGYFVDEVDRLFINGGIAKEVNLIDNAVRTKSVTDLITQSHKMYAEANTAKLPNGFHHEEPSQSKPHSLSTQSNGATVGSVYYNCVKVDSNNPLCPSHAYGDSGAVIPGDIEACVMVLVRNYSETFQMDQMAVIQGLTFNNIYVVITTLEDAAQSEYSVTSGDDLSLIFTLRDRSKTFSVSTLYFRGGYDPGDYVNEQCWKFLEDAELSRTVLLPSVGLHLAGTKRVQCALAENNFKLIDELSDAMQSAQDFKSTFVAQYELNESNLPDILENAENYVVKPQREGGRNNLFGDEIVQHFKNITNKSVLKQYIAMERIRGLEMADYPVRDKESEVKCISQAVAEVGTMATLLVDTRRRHDDNMSNGATPNGHTCANNNNVYSNGKCGESSGHDVVDEDLILGFPVMRHDFMGYLTKVKSASSNEAGVSVGHGYLASVAAMPPAGSDY